MICLLSLYSQQLLRARLVLYHLAIKLDGGLAYALHHERFRLALKSRWRSIRNESRWEQLEGKSPPTDLRVMNTNSPPKEQRNISLTAASSHENERQIKKIRSVSLTL